jgi:hypothetical protein
MIPTRFTNSFNSIFAVCLLTAAIFILTGTALAQAPVKARLTFSKASFTLDDPAEKIAATITLQNKSGSPVYTQENFSGLGYHLQLYFVGPEPDGTLIGASLNLTGSPTPNVPPRKVISERLPYDWLINMDIEEIRNYYALTQPGRYKAWFEMAFVQYDPNQAEPFDKDGDGQTDGYRVPHDAVIYFEPPVSSAPVYITLTEETAADGADVRVEATEFVYDAEDKKGVTQKPLMGLDVRVYRVADIEKAGISPVNHKVYEDIAKNPLIPVFKTALQTTTPGEYRCGGVPKDDYVVIGHADWVTAYKHLGSMVESDDDNWENGEIFVNLKLQTGKKEKKDKKKK